MNRASALAAVGVLAGGALALGVAAPANAVDVAPLSSYMLTVPPSVYSASAGYSPAEQVAWRESSRLGVDPKVPTVPVSGGAAWGILGGVQALWLGGQFIVENAGTLGTVFGVSPGQMAERYAEQGLSGAEGWQCESLEGDWLGDLVTGFNDWFQGLFGVDCAALRDGELEKNPEYEPLLVTDPGAFTWPKTIQAGPVSATVSEPVYAAGFGNTSAVPGWVGLGYVYPVSVSTPAPYFVHVWLSETSASGSVDVGGNGMVMSGSTMGGNAYSVSGSAAQAMCGAPFCLSPNKLARANASGAEAKLLAGTHSYSIRAIRVYEAGSCVQMVGYACTTLNPIPPLDFAPVSTGSSAPVPKTAEVVFRTTVETQDGNTYQCRTRPFLETDVDVPTPCEPTIPGDEWMIRRVVEMIPATSSDWVVGSDPRRVMTDQESPQEYRDWKTAFPMCSDSVCRLDLVKIGKGSCFQLGDTCDGWASDPNRSSLYSCTYNGQTVSLGECEAAYPNVFNQQARDLGQAYPQPTDPATGQPSTGGQTSTVAGPVTSPGSWPQNPEQPRNCFPTGWNAFNPFEWIYKPVRCVIEWAFVPRQSYIDNVIGNMRAVWTSASLVSLLGVLEQGADVMFGPQGCEGPPVDLNIYGASYSGHPFSACGQFAGAAAITSTVTGIAAWLFASLSIARSIAGVVAFKGIGGGDEE